MATNANDPNNYDRTISAQKLNIITDFGVSLNSQPLLTKGSFTATISGASAAAFARTVNFSIAGDIVALQIGSDIAPTGVAVANIAQPFSFQLPVNLLPILDPPVDITIPVSVNIVSPTSKIITGVGQVLATGTVRFFPANNTGTQSWVLADVVAINVQMVYRRSPML